MALRREGCFANTGFPAPAEPTVRAALLQGQTDLGTWQQGQPGSASPRGCMFSFGAPTFSTCPSTTELSPADWVSPSPPWLPAATYQGFLSVGGLCLQSCGDIDQGSISPARAKMRS